MSEQVYESLFFGAVPMDEMLEARLEAAGALRRLSQDFLKSDVSVAELKKLALIASQGSEALDRAPRRRTGRTPEEMQRILEYHSSDRATELSPQDLFADSVVSGSGNPMSMGLRLSRDGDVAVGEVVLGPAFEGATDRSHGGIVAALVDETYGCLIMIMKAMAFTGQLNLTYKAACPLGVPIEFRAHLEKIDGRKIHTRCIGTGPEGVFVEADAIFISVDRINLPNKS